MNLRASIAKVQNLGARFYLQLAKHYDQNTLIRDTWVEMGDDFQNQVSSLKKLRPLFWKQLQKEEKTLLTVTKETDNLLHAELATQPSEWSLQRCFTRTLGFEEPIIIRLYAPLLYRLRNVGTDHALDFYIMVTAHVTRLTRLVQLFSGDPALIERCSALLHGFERAAHGPEPESVIAKKKTRVKRAAARRRLVASVKRVQKSLLRARKTAKPRRPLPKRSKVLSKRARPLLLRARKSAKPRRPLAGRAKVLSKRARPLLLTARKSAKPRRPLAGRAKVLSKRARPLLLTARKTAKLRRPLAKRAKVISRRAKPLLLRARKAAKPRRPLAGRAKVISKRAKSLLLRARKTAKPRRPLAKRAKVISKRAKPLVKNLNLRRTRARR